MAIQIPNPGTGNGASGDNEFVLWSKVKDNFSDTTHAANKIVGKGAEQIPQNKHLGAAAYEEVGASIGGLIKYGDMGLGLQRTSYPPVSQTNPADIAAGFFTTENDSPLKDSKQSTYDNMGLKIPSNIPSTGGYLMFPYEVSSGNTITYTAYRAQSGLTKTVHRLYSDKNTTIVNGSIKPSSPVVKIHTNSLELNDDAERMGATLNKRGVGDYLLQNTTGLRNDGGWRIELPQDVNGNPYFAVAYNELENNDIEVKTYKRIFDMNTFTFVPDLDNPVDIKEGRSIAIRFNDLPDDVLDDTQVEGIAEKDK